MKGDEFIAEVRIILAELASKEEAQKATSALFETETPRERLAGNEPSNLASQLPPETASCVEGSVSGESFSGRSLRR
jgi:uncharacterized protein (DUF2267 family)